MNNFVTFKAKTLTISSGGTGLLLSEEKTLGLLLSREQRRHSIVSLPGDVGLTVKPGKHVLHAILEWNFLIFERTAG